MPRSGLIWTEKYAPETLADITGQDKAVARIERFLDEFPKKRALLLAGPPGAGKSSAVMAIAKARNAELIELNASDFRKEADINDRIRNAVEQQSLFGKSKIILIDEVDGISGRYDRGGANAVAKLIEKSRFPIFLTANDTSDRKLKDLKKKAELVEFEKVPYTAAAQILRRICDEEGIECDERALTDLAAKSSGDLRAAITDLQLLATEKITRERVASLDDREREEKIVQALVRVLKTSQEDAALNAFDFLREDIDQIMLWVDRNVPSEYRKPADLARAYERIVKTDILNRRIRRRQHWRFLAYMYYDLTVGIALAKDERYPGAPKVSEPTRVLSIWRANMKRVHPKAIAEKLSPALHRSRNDLLKEDLAYIRIIATKDPAFREKLAERFDLDEKQAKWLAEGAL